MCLHEPDREFERMLIGRKRARPYVQHVGLGVGLAACGQGEQAGKAADQHEVVEAPTEPCAPVAASKGGCAQGEAYAASDEDRWIGKAYADRHERDQGCHGLPTVRSPPGLHREGHQDQRDEDVAAVRLGVPREADQRIG